CRPPIVGHARLRRGDRSGYAPCPPSKLALGRWDAKRRLAERKGMTAEVTGTAAIGEAATGDATRADARMLRRLVVMLGLGWSILFVLIGVGFRLQLYGDGSIFSYSIAVEAGWGYHFHNIADRMFVYAFSHLPAEAYVALTRDARGGIF